MAENGTSERLLGQLLAESRGMGRELGEIKQALAGLRKDLVDSHRDLHQRVSVLEMDKAAAKGGMRVLIVISGAVASLITLIGGFASGLFGR